MNVHQTLEKKNALITKAEGMLARGVKPDSVEYREILKQITETSEDYEMLSRISSSLPAVRSAAPITNVPTIIAETSRTERARINSAYTTVLRHGNPPEERDLVTNVDASGGSLVPQAFDTDWAEALKQASGIDQLVHRYGSGESFRPVKTVQVDTTSTNLAYVPEIGSTTTNALQTPALLSQIQNADNLVLRTTLSWQELDDAFDVLGWLKRSIAPIVSRGLSWAILTGTDPATSTALANSPAGGLTAFAPTGVTGASGSLATGPNYAELIALRSSVGSYAYQFTPKSGFVASEVTHNFLAAQLNSIGEPLYKRCPDTNLLMIAGSLLYVAQAGSMPAFNVAGSKAVLFGAWDRAYAFVQTNPKFQVLQINPQQMTTDVIIRLRFGSVGLYSNAASAFTTAAS
jgi:HK97 family phage major capsid protein